VTGPAATTTEVADIDVGPLGLLTAGPAGPGAATTEVEDVDGRPPGLYAVICSEFYKKKMLVVTSDPGGAGPELPLLASIHRPHS
jgi:hypothetical protein